MQGKKYPTEVERIQAKRASSLRSAKKFFATAKGKAARARVLAKHGARHAREHRARLRAMLHEFKARPCADCAGTFDPVCMDFDHRPGESKLFDISDNLGGRAIAATLAEIAKCDIVCANCHRIRTLRKRDHAALCGRRAQAESPQLALDLAAGLQDHGIENADMPRADGYTEPEPGGKAVR